MAGEAVLRCKAGGTFPKGLVKQVAEARVAQPREVTERLSRRQRHDQAVAASDEDDGGLAGDGEEAADGDAAWWW